MQIKIVLKLNNTHALYNYYHNIGSTYNNYCFHLFNFFLISDSYSEARLKANKATFVSELSSANEEILIKKRKSD